MTNHGPFQKRLDILRKFSSDRSSFGGHCFGPGPGFLSGQRQWTASQWTASQWTASQWTASEWTGPGSNRRHQDFQSCALPTELPVQEPPIIWKTPSVASADEVLPALSIFANAPFPPNGKEPVSKRPAYGRTTLAQFGCQADPKRRCSQAAQIPEWPAHLPTSPSSYKQATDSYKQATEAGKI